MKSDQTLEKLKKWKSEKKAITLVTGVFDILHIEHFRFLKKSKETGDRLIVGIECDERVMEIKGNHRPVNNQEVRMEQLNALKVVDWVFVLPKKFDSQEDWEGLMKKISPDVYAVSSHTSYLTNKKQIANMYGADLEVVYKFNPEVSTSKIFAKIGQDL